MIPILYDGTEKNFTNNGLGRLSDAISCKVTEERNGIFELEMTYPISGIHYAELELNKIILAKTEEGGSPQAFIIYSITRPLDGIVTVKGNHISYILNGVVVMPFEAASLAEAMSKISDNAVIETPFTFQTDVSSIIHFSFDTPRSIRSLLGGEQGSLLDVYGGYDYRFNNFQVSLLADRGSDNGVVLRYGKNITELKNLENTTNVYTGIVPYWSNETTTVYLDEKVVYSDHASDYPYKIIRTVDFSEDFENEPTQAQLKAKAESYLQSNQGWKLKSNINVSFVALWQSDEYKDIAALERVRMCDTVRVVYSKLGVNIKTKVIKTIYNVLLERYEAISLGDATYDLTQAIHESIVNPEIQKSESFTKNAVARATKLIQGGLGGHVVFNTNGDGEPQEILIMDTDDIQTAVNVIRMNLNGIGFSHNGYNGPFDTAWTIDGAFVADYITAGTLNGEIIRAQTLQVDAFSENAKNELDLIHNYLPYDIFSNIDRWEYNAHAVSLGTYTVDGITYDCMFMDGTGIHSYDQTYRARVKSDYMGRPTLSIKFNYIFKNDVTVTEQQFFYLYYKKTNGTYFTSYWTIASGTYAKDTVYTFSATKVFTDDVDPSYTPRIGFRFIPDVETCITNFTVTGLMGNYEKSTLSFTADGLSSVVQKGSVISSINQSAESVSINASRIDLSGNLNLRGDFTAYDSSDEYTYAELKDGELVLYHGSGQTAHKTIELVTGITTDDEITGHINIYQGNRVVSVLNNHYMEAPAVYTDKLNVHGDVNCFSDGQLTVYGAANFKGNVYNVSGGIVFVSDKRKKKNIKDLVVDKARSFVMALKPRSFKFKKGISRSNRTHHGFIAQEVKEAMTEDWGLYIEDQDKDFVGLRYDEFIADMVVLLQNHEKRIQELENEIKMLKGEQNDHTNH